MWVGNSGGERMFSLIRFRGIGGDGVRWIPLEFWVWFFWRGGGSLMLYLILIFYFASVVFVLL